MNKGDLVVSSFPDGKFGIILNIHTDNVEVFWGDGLRELVNINQLETVDFSETIEPTITANFTELVDAYIANRGFA